MTTTPAADDHVEIDVDRLIRRTEVLASGLSNMYGTYLTPGSGWTADPVTGEITYDIGLASVLDDDAQMGVALHEIGHLRFSDPLSDTSEVVRAASFVNDARDEKWAWHLINMFEDCRIERLMAGQFPGAAPCIARLREAWHNPVTQNQLGVTDSHMQFINGLYCVAFGLPFTLTDPLAVAAVDQHKSELLDLVFEKSTVRMTKGLLRTDGIGETMFKLIQAGTTRQDPQHFSPPPPTDDNKDDALASFADDPDDPDPDDLDDDPVAGSDPDDDQDDDPAGQDPASQPSGDAQPGGPDDQQPGDPVFSPPDPTAGDDDPVLGAMDPAAGGDSAGGDEPPDPSDLAALTPAAKSLLDDAVAANQRDDDLTIPDRDEAENLRGDLAGTRNMVQRANDAAEQILAGRQSSRDDKTYGLDDDIDTYEELRIKTADVANVLGRELQAVLDENRFDRWGGAYESGGRLNATVLPRVRSGERRVFQRKVRARNRQFAVGVAIDVSASMGLESRLAHAMLSGVLIAEALERSAGIDYSVYAFGQVPVCLKPYGMSLDSRAGKIGEFARNVPGIGHDTQTGKCLRRMGQEILEYDEEWRKLLIVVTDGESRDTVEPVCRELVRSHGIDIVGIGIGTDTTGMGVDKMSGEFPAWVRVQQAYDLPEALIRILRRTVVKG